MTEVPRRHVLIGGLTLAALAASPHKAVMADPDRPPQPVEDRLGEMERRQNALIGVFATDLGTGHTIAHRAQDMFARCSTF